jgi:formylglycine-generating enzyme required for sulfatase activity/serine/threonine protein kinase
MSQPSVDQIVQSLRTVPVLGTRQLGEVASTLVPRFAEPRELLAELVRRGWLTQFQSERLLKGRPEDLQVGSYLLLERVGQGGMGEVFKARHQLLGRTVALKVTRKDILDDPTCERRFVREIQTTAQLAHPNIVAAHDAAQVGDLCLFAMEYVEGTDLSRLIRETGPLPIHRACEYVRQAALGLQHAHEHGLVHRDIKPSNLLLTADGSQVKIADMGLVHLDEECGEAALTETGMTVGTPDYLAPEQALNSRKVDIRADLYSLGGTLYFLLSGQHPFPEGTALEKLCKHLNDSPVSVRERRPEVPVELEAVVLRLMAKDPADRYQQPSEVARVLEPFCSAPAAPVSQPRGLASDHLPAPAPSPPTSPTPAPAQTPPTRERPAPEAALAALGLSPVTERRAPAPARVAASRIEDRGSRIENSDGATPTPGAEPAPAAPAPSPQAGPPASGTGGRRRWLVGAGTALLIGCVGALWQPWGAAPGHGGKSAVANSIGMQLVRIPAGEFTMGAPPGEKGRRADESPCHPVVISQPFYLAAHETTVAQFRAFVQATGYRTEAEKGGAGAWRWDAPTRSWKSDPQCTWQNPGWPQADNEPVVCVSRLDALAFCYWLSRKEGKVYRLPTEAEWEYACRGGTSTPYAGGSALSRRQANYDNAGPQPTNRVGSLAPNPWGLHDMHGNVWEWCADRYDPAYYRDSPARDPCGPARGTGGVVRGGSWQSGAGDCRSARRRETPAETRRNDIGFRVLREAGVR